jgi:hypothetical protein
MAGGGTTGGGMVGGGDAGTCMKTTCAASNKNCGTISDGCGASLDCGTCNAPQTCSGGGVTNVCGYSTDFSGGPQNPIDPTVWLGGQTYAGKWTDVERGVNVAFGAPTNTNYSCGGNAGQYADPTAMLRGGGYPDGAGNTWWAPNQKVTATAYCGPNVTSVSYPEVELRLRHQLRNGWAQGYEIMWRCSSSSKLGTSYVALARWNGALCDYTILTNIGGGGVVDGDAISAQIVGNTITFSKNGQPQGSVTDNSPPDASFAFGNPGIGFNYLAADNGNPTSGLNNQFGLSHVTATDLP